MRRADIEVPNLPVDVDSWGRSACYPWSSFYPLIFAPPTWAHRFTKFRFRDCSSCPSCSKAGLCLYTSGSVSIGAKPTFKRLRYFLGGIRPRQTTHLTLSSADEAELDAQNTQGGISLSAPPDLAIRNQSLPPILNSAARISISSYSKASQGLFVLLRVSRIFTTYEISPSP